MRTIVDIPDAIIWATAKSNSSLLITRNTKDFPPQATDIKIPYGVISKSIALYSNILN